MLPNLQYFLGKVAEQMEEKALKAKIRSNMTPEEIKRLEAEEAAVSN